MHLRGTNFLSLQLDKLIENLSNDKLYMLATRLLIADYGYLSRKNLENFILILNVYMGRKHIQKPNIRKIISRIVHYKNLYSTTVNDRTYIYMHDDLDDLKNILVQSGLNPDYLIYSTPFSEDDLKKYDLRRIDTLIFHHMILNIFQNRHNKFYIYRNIAIDNKLNADFQIQSVKNTDFQKVLFLSKPTNEMAGELEALCTLYPTRGIDYSLIPCVDDDLDMVFCNRKPDEKQHEVFHLLSKNYDTFSSYYNLLIRLLGDNQKNILDVIMNLKPYIEELSSDQKASHLNWIKLFYCIEDFLLNDNYGKEWAGKPASEFSAFLHQLYTETKKDYKILNTEFFSNRLMVSKKELSQFISQKQIENDGNNSVWNAMMNGMSISVFPALVTTEVVCRVHNRLDPIGIRNRLHNLDLLTNYTSIKDIREKLPLNFEIFQKRITFRNAAILNNNYYILIEDVSQDLAALYRCSEYMNMPHSDYIGSLLIMLIDDNYQLANGEILWESNHFKRIEPTLYFSAHGGSHFESETVLQNSYDKAIFTNGPVPLYMDKSLDMAFITYTEWESLNTQTGSLWIYNPEKHEIVRRC